MACQMSIFQAVCIKVERRKRKLCLQLKNCKIAEHLQNPSFKLCCFPPFLFSLLLLLFFFLGGVDVFVCLFV